MSRIVVDDARVPMRDGIELASDVIRIDDEVRRPVLLVRTPYTRAALRAGQDPVALARAGWAVVLQDVRGRWDSDGDYAPFSQEIPDGADAVRWCAAQPWSNGAVVMGGASYDGLTAWLAASELPEALRAIGPVVSAPDTRDPWVRRGGALNLGFLLNWGIGLGIMGIRTDPELQVVGTTWHSDFRTTVRSPEVLDRLTTVFPGARPWLEEPSGERTPGFGADTALARVGLPIYHLTGWYDIFVEGALAAYRTMLDSPAAASQRLVVGPWTHGTVYGTSAGDHEYGTEASGFLRFPAERLEFLRTAAAGGEPQGGASVWVMGSDRWLDLDAWPPPTVPNELDLGVDEHGSGTLGHEPGTATTLSWYHDRDHPVPTRGGRVLHPGTDIAGPVLQPTEPHPDVVRFDSAVLTDALTVAGSVTVHLRFSADTDIADLTAKLIDVHPGGEAYNVVDGVRRTTGGDPVPCVVDLGSTAMTFRAGHRIRLELAGSNFPAFDLTASGERRIEVGAGSGAVLRLPVLPAPAS